MSEAQSASDTVVEDTDYTAATVRASTKGLQTLVQETALTKGGGPIHDIVYMNVSDGQIQCLAGSHGNVVVSYTTWNEESMKQIGVTEQTENNTPDGEKPTLEAVVDTQEFLNYLNIASDGGVVELDFIKEPQVRLAQALRITGKLTSRVPLPGSDAVLEEVPLDLPTQVNDDNVLINPNSGEELPTHVSAGMQEMEKIVDAVDVHEDAEEDFFPVVVEDGTFSLNVGDAQSQQIFGSFSTGVEGPDFDNEYHTGFKELVNSLSGQVEIYSVDDGPLYVLQDGNGSTVRHSIGNVS